VTATEMTATEITATKMTATKSRGIRKPSFKKPSYRNMRKIHALIFLLPFLIGFFLFFATPLFQLIRFSLSIISVPEAGGMELTFVGFQNFIGLFTAEVSTDNQQFLRVFTDENVRIFLNAPVIVVFSLMAAMVVNVSFRGQGIVRTIFFLPIVTGLPVVQVLLSVTTGADIMDASISDTLIAAPVMDLLLSYTFLPVDVVIFIAGVANEIFNLIANAGVQTLIFLAGLQSINASLYEVAKIEGANVYETFWKITFPMLTNIIVFVIVYTFVDLFLTSLLTHEIFAYGFMRNNIGMGAALSLVYMVNIVVGLLALIFLFRKLMGKYE